MSINKLFSTLICICAIAACSSTKQNEWFVSRNGNMPTEERIAQIKDGYSKDDVLQILGAPSAQVSFNKNTWIYMSSDIKRVAFFKPEETHRDILKIQFNDDGKVIEVARLNKDCGKDVEVVTDKTEVKGQQPGFFRKYFGGVGQYNPFAGNNSANGL